MSSERVPSAISPLMYFSTMREAMGAKKMAMKNKSAVNTEVRPVFPPSAMPLADSTNVDTVELPQTAPAQVAMASASMACSMRGTLPFSSSSVIS